jgi:hypothetical protein
MAKFATPAWAASNGSWEVKRKEIMKHSLLPINQDLGDLAEWDEKAIGARSGRMFERALTLWPR